MATLEDHSLLVEPGENSLENLLKYSGKKGSKIKLNVQRTEGNFDIFDQDLNLDPGKFFLTYPSRKLKHFLTKIVEIADEFCYPRSVVKILHIIP